MNAPHAVGGEGLVAHKAMFESNKNALLSVTSSTPSPFIIYSQDLYLKKNGEVDVQSQRVTVGLEKLKKGAADVETMKV